MIQLPGACGVLCMLMQADPCAGVSFSQERCGTQIPFINLSFFSPVKLLTGSDLQL